MFLLNKIYDSEVLKKINFFKKVKLFEGIKKRDLIYLLDIFKERKYLKGETIFVENDIGRALFIVYDGKVGLYNKIKDENNLIASVNSGEFFGEMALLEELPRTASAIAMEDTTVFMLYKQKMESLIYSKPRIGSIFLYKLSIILSARIRNLMLEKNKNE